MSVDWGPLRDIINRNQRFVLTTHVRPDADALGSELGMAGLLEIMGKSVRIINSDGVPARLAFLDPHKKCLTLGHGVTEEEAAQTDVHMILDTSAWNQLAKMGNIYRRSKAVKVVVDHHATAEDIGGIPFKDTQSEATGALVCQIADAIGVKPTPEIASALYCAIATDTGWFRFPSTTSETMRTIARLIDFGANPALLYQQLYEQCTAARLRLASRVLARISQDCGGKLAHSYVKWEDYGETGAEPSETEDLVNQCLTITGVEVAFIQIEQSNKMIKTSFRSRVPLDISKVAEQFQGGGHKQAAGAILPGPLPEARAKVLTAVRAFLERETPT